MSIVSIFSKPGQSGLDFATVSFGNPNVSPERDWRQFAEDICESITLINSYMAGRGREDLQRNPLIFDAIIRRFEVIGVASRHIPETIRERHGDIPWREMRDMRNFAAHVYWGVNVSQIWQTIQDDLPPLLEAMNQLIEQECNE